MRKYQYICIGLAVVLTICGCNNCGNDYEDLDFPPYMHQYFGVFEEGNYFVYINRDSTKRDSMYISDYSEREVVEHIDCTRNPVRRGFIHSEYLWDGVKLRFGYQNFGLHSAEFAINDGNYPTDFAMFFDTNLDTVLLQSHSVVPEYLDTMAILGSPIGTVVEVWRFPNSVIGDLYFAKDKGLVKYTVPSSQDTFKLVNYHIQ